jgi:DNA repair protein RadC
VPVGYCARKRRFSYGPPFRIEQSSTRPHVALSHNHPSGIPEPSEADRSITLKLSKALALVEVRLLDHVVVAGDTFVSFAERGLL